MCDVTAAFGTWIQISICICYLDNKTFALALAYHTPLDGAQHILAITFSPSQAYKQKIHLLETCYGPGQIINIRATIRCQAIQQLGPLFVQDDSASHLLLQLIGYNHPRDVRDGAFPRMAAGCIL